MAAQPALQHGCGNQRLLPAGKQALCNDVEQIDQLIGHTGDRYRRFLAKDQPDKGMDHAVREQE
ncbi:hypothetical protein D3C76_1431890 [compost metagenome]